jgi:hypothetical protein
MTDAATAMGTIDQQPQQDTITNTTEGVLPESGGVGGWRIIEADYVRFCQSVQ